MDWTSSYAKIDIFTDFQVAIDGINALLTTLSSSKYWLKANNNSFISNIIYRIANLILDFKFYKIKGYSGIKYNNRADTLSKQVVCEAKTNLSLILNINDV